MRFFRNCCLGLLPILAVQAQTSITLSVATPASGLPGVSAVSVSAIGLPSGTVTTAATQITLQPAAAGAGLTATVAPSGIAAITGGQRFSFTLPAALAVSAATPYLISVAGTTSTNATFTSGNRAAITLNPPALSSLSLSPAAVIGPASSNGKVTLTGPAPGSGAVVQLGSGNSNVGSPASQTITVPGGATTSPAFAIVTNAIPAASTAAISATFLGVTKSQNLTVNPILVTAFTLIQTSVTGGLPDTGRVTINSPAPIGGIDVVLGGGTSFLVLPLSVHIADSATTATFTILTAPVTTDIVAPLTATLNSVTKNANLTVLADTVSSLQLVPASVIGSISSTANKVILAGPAPPGGLDVLLQSDQSAASPPPAVHVTDGTTQATFTITTSPVASTTPAHITASLGPSSKQATLTLTTIAVSALALATTTVGGNPLTAIVILNAPAAGSDAVVQLTTSDPNRLSIPPTVTVPIGAARSAAIPITTQAVATPTVVHVTAAYGGVTKAIDITINPPSLLSLALSPGAVLGNLSTTGNRVTLNGPAPAGGITVGLSSADPVNAIVPTNVVVPEGAKQSPTFTIDTKPVPAQTVIAITATYETITKSANLTVNPIIVQTVILSPATIASGLTTTGNKITLNSAAPTGDAVVALSTDSPALLTLPPSITIPAGQTTSSAFTISTNWSGSQKVAKIIATYNNVPKSANLTINPTSLTTLTLSPVTAIGSVNTTVNIVKLDSPAGPGGAAVSLTSSNSLAASVPVTVMVPEGQTASAPFTIQTFPVSSDTPVTITAAYVAQKTATLTVKPILITALTLSPANVAGGLPSTGNKVTINSPAPATGTVVALASGNGIATLAPPNITILPGQTVSSPPLPSIRIP